MVEVFKNLPPELVVFLVASLPIFELRGAIPLGILHYNLPLWKTLVLGILGNLLPVPFLLILLRPIAIFTGRWRITKKFFEFLYDRARRKGVSIARLKLLGLYLFVAIPLPGTGAWTGSLVAEVFNMDFKHSLFAITLGVITAGFVMTFVSSFGIIAVIVFFTALAVISYILSRGSEGPLSQ
ncbi:MAG: small multi-drug export protein [candidate division WOR-3 bacterium]